MRENAFVALGSNLGDRAAYLEAGRHHLARLPRTSVVAQSDLEETEPLGAASQSPYLNQMVLLATDLSPRELLQGVAEGEQAAGRIRGERWGSRTLDLDIVRFGDRVVQEPDLVIPHPELRHRPFWLRELAQLLPASLDPRIDPGLPEWATVSETRREHITRVAALMATWAIAMARAPEERRRWLRAAYLHDALRDAPANVLKRLASVCWGASSLAHGPAAAAQAAAHGETDQGVLDAVRYHSVGCPGWDEVGRMLYMADYLEPGRPFRQPERAAVAAAVPNDPDGCLRVVAAERLVRTVTAHRALLEEGVAFWNALVSQS